MLEMNFTAMTATDTNPMTVTKVLNSNNNLKLNNNTVNYLNPGIYEIDGSITLQATATSNTGISMYVNGELQGTSDYYLAASIGAIATIPIYNVVQINSSTTNEYASSVFKSVGNPTVIGGTVSIKKIV